MAKFLKFNSSKNVEHMLKKHNVIAAIFQKGCGELRINCTLPLSPNLFKENPSFSFKYQRS